MKLFGGSAHPTLTAEVSRLLSLPIARAEIVRFDDSEVKVTIQEDVKNQTCIVIQPTTNPTDTNLIELYLFCDALKRCEATKVIGVIPYFGYSRQDRQHRPGECVSMNMVVRFLELVGFDKIYTFELHEDASADMFSISFENLSALPILATFLKKGSAGFSENNTAIVSPDQDGTERARLFADNLFGENKGTIGSVEKHRNLDTIHESKAVNVFADVKNKKVILVDDVISSGGTLTNAADICLQKGATEIYAAVTHHDFSPGAPKKLQNSALKKIYTSNTIPMKKEWRFEKLEEVSIASIICDKIKSGEKQKV